MFTYYAPDFIDFPRRDSGIYLSSKMATNMKDYRGIAVAKKHEQLNQIPKAWQIDATAFDNVANVMTVPLTCGLLDETEAS